MKSIRPLRVAVCLLLASAVTAAAQAPSGKPAPPTLDPQSLGAFLTSEVANRHLVGLSLAVMQDGKLIYAGGAGRSAIDPDAPVGPEVRFAIGSITKQFTSACILLLAEEGKLSTSDKIAKWFPELTKADDITVLDLMNHVSGYPDYYPLDFVDRPMQKPIAVDDLIDRFGTRKLDFEPGTRYSYSNTGYVILGRIVSKVSGEPFSSFLQRRILKPLGLVHTVFQPPATAPGLAQGYVTFALGPPEPATPEGFGWVDAAGALYSTPTDLAAWDLALMDGKLLKPESYALMATPRTLANGSTANYGCGLAIGRLNGQPVLGHNGAVAGFYARNTMIPSSRSSVVLLSNLDSYDAVDAVYTQVLNAVVPPPSQAGGVPSIAGPSAPAAARLLFLALQNGHVDRALLGEEYSHFLTDEKIAAASARLKPWGEPTRVEVESVSERGGMEVARTRLVFANGVLKGLMYRTPDGKVQEFFVERG